MMIDELMIVVRLLIATVLGGVIGLERQQRNKFAGLRTHILVCIGSCLIMEISINIYAGVQGLTNADPARLAAQVVSGIGFLGAGTIMKEGLTVRGLTTAASLWVVAGVGLAVGAGYYVGAIATTVITFLALTYLPRYEKLYQTGARHVGFILLSDDKPGQIGRIGSFLGSKGLLICDIKIEDLGNHEISISLVVDFPDKRLLPEVIQGMAALEGIKSITQE